MANYVDIETSAEALQEDEELIEAVEAMVEIAAESVKTSIMQEVNSVSEQVQSFVEAVFPILVDYRRDPLLFWQDMEHLGIFLLLFVIAFILLTPSSSRRQQQQRRDKKNKLANGNAEISGSAKGLRHFRNRSFGGGYAFLSDSGEGSFSWNDDLMVDSNSNSLNSVTARQLMMDNESDEERFQRVYPSLYADSKYANLILPPECQLIEKPKASELLRQHQQQQKQKEAARKAAQHGKDQKLDEADDPARRLQTYFRQFMILIRSLFTFDYAGAAWTILQWLKGIREHRRRTNGQAARGGNEDDDDDVDHIASAASLEAVSSGDESYHSPQKSDNARATALEGSDARDDEDALADGCSVDESNRSDDKDEEEENRATATVTSSSTPFATPSAGDGSSSSVEVGPLTPRVPLLESSRNRKQSSESTNATAKALSPLVEEKKEAHTPETGSDGDPAAAEELPGPRPLAFLKKRFPSFRRNVSDSSSVKTEYHDMATVSSAEPARTNRSTDSFKQREKEKRDPVDAGCENDSTADVPHKQLAGVEDETAASLEQRPWYFFETAQSKESLKKMSIEVQVPDRNGYILGDEYLPDDRCTPLLAFVNSRSGVRQGHFLITQLRRLLNPIQVWDLADGSPEPILESFCKLAKLRILVCGGDGTVSWIISALDSLKLKRKWPPIAILPLGTGNDLARIHGWGAGYSNESLNTILEQVSDSYISILDRWELTVQDGKKRVTTKNFLNYFSVGVDAEAALQVHNLRERRPEWFFSRLVNKAWYGALGAEQHIKGNGVNIRREVALFADGVHVPLPADSQGIIILNIDSYAGGVPLWTYGVKKSRTHATIRRSQSMGGIGDLNARGGMSRLASVGLGDSTDDLTAIPLTEEERIAKVTACDTPGSCQDGYLEIVSVRGFAHLGQCTVGLGHAERVGQCRELKIVIKQKVAVQIDGEPWRQDKCTLRIKRKPDPALMLHRSADDGGIETEMSKLLEWAEERRLIDGQVHSVLMKEFSRRIESKIQQRRFRTAEHNVIQNLKRAIGSTGAISSLSGRPTKYPSTPSFHLPPQADSDHSDILPREEEGFIRRSSRTMMCGQDSGRAHSHGAIAF